MHKPTRQHAGFTLIELLVAVSLLGLLLFLINDLFTNTSAAVSTSAQNSKVIATARVIGQQIDDDTRAMLGPKAGEGGYIVIIQQRIKGAKFINPDTLAEFTDPNFELRSDQLVFIRDAVGVRSMTPQDAQSYRSNLVGQPGGVARVWYGAGLRTKTDGTPLGTGGSFRLGRPDAELDSIGNNWVLARQCLLFNPRDEVVNRVVSDAPGAYVNAVTARRDSPVQGVGGYSGPKTLYMGLTDVTRQNYALATDSTSLVNQLEDPNVQPAAQIANYLNTAFAYNPDNRLRVNPSPSPADTGYEPWAIAQTHPILATHCSEFVVQFAADLNGNGLIDTVEGGGPDDRGNGIYWYDALTPTNQGFNFLWSNSTRPQPSTGLPADYFQPYVNINQDMKAFVFRFSDDEPIDPNTSPTRQTYSNWPYLIRIRYRLHDDRGRLKSNNPAALSDKLDNDGDGSVDEAGEDRASGRWYEHIIRVPRPEQ